VNPLDQGEKAPVRRTSTLLVMILLAVIAATACRHKLGIPGGEIRIGRETHPTGPIITPESQSGAPCGPGLSPCPGTTQCFAVGVKASCMTEDAACAAARCGIRPCQVIESFPMKAICR
jgi:hypothetical protein